MCTQKPPNDYSQVLYDRYKQALDDHIESVVRVLLLISHPFCFGCFFCDLAARFRRCTFRFLVR